MTDDLLEEIRDTLLPEHKGEGIVIPIRADDVDVYEVVTGSGKTAFTVNAGFSTHTIHTHTNLPRFTTQRGGIRFNAP